MTLGANKVAVCALRLQVSLQIASCNLDLLTGCTSNLLLTASLTMCGFLKDFERWASAAIGALDDAEFALFEDVLRVIFVCDGLLLAGVVSASESSTVEHGLFNWVHFINGFNLLVTVLAGGLLGVGLAWTANQFGALTAITTIDSDKTAVAAES